MFLQMAFMGFPSSWGQFSPSYTVRSNDSERMIDLTETGLVRIDEVQHKYRLTQTVENVRNNSEHFSKRGIVSEFANRAGW